MRERDLTSAFQMIGRVEERSGGVSCSRRDAANKILHRVAGHASFRTLLCTAGARDAGHRVILVRQHEVSSGMARHVDR